MESRSLTLGALSVAVVGATLACASSAQAIMFPGDSGSGVARLQEQLGIVADGVYGPRTEAAVYTFQVRSGLLADGVAGPQTLSALGLPSNLGPGGGGGERPISGYATVTAGSGLNVRAYPGGPIIGGLAYGQSVALSGAVSGGWYQLASGGWVSGNWLSVGGSGGGGEVPVGGGAFVNAAIGLNVRSSPAGAVWYALPNGASVTLTGASQFAAGRTWVQLTDGGWVAQDFISYN